VQRCSEKGQFPPQVVCFHDNALNRKILGQGHSPFKLKVWLAAAKH
jgi:hypothetical protein